jgi:hypothetical protein
MRSFTATSAAGILAYATTVAAFWRMPCRSSTGIGRIDPIVNPGQVADHAHLIFGGGNFHPTTNTYDLTHATGDADCTSCEVTQDQSAYWTPPLYFQHKDGTVEMVPNVGGMLAYYLFYLKNIQPFPEGFQVVAGTPSLRNFSGPFPDAELSSWPTVPNDQFFLQQRAIGFNCLNYARDPEPSLYRHTLPTKEYMDANCKDGLRLEFAFPSCGNGKATSDDNRSHMKYPSLVKEGNCPEGYDVHYPFLFYETIFDTGKFAGVDGQFVLSPGDPVGTGYHADFIMGWESADFLGRAINTCTNPSGQISDCPLFNIQSDAKAARCKFKVPDMVKDDDCAGPRTGLPVGVPIQYGPEQATKYAVPGQNGAAYTAPSASPTSQAGGLSLGVGINLGKGINIGATLNIGGAGSSAAATTSSPPTSAAAPPTTAAPAPQPTTTIQTHATTSSTAYVAPVAAPAAPAPENIYVGAGGKVMVDKHQQAPAPTAAAVAAADAGKQQQQANKIVATSYSTDGNNVYEVLIEEVVHTVTAYADAAAPTNYAAQHKRHLERHAHHARH